MDSLLHSLESDHATPGKRLLKQFLSISWLLMFFCFLVSECHLPSVRIDEVVRCSFSGVRRTKKSWLTTPLRAGKERLIQFGLCTAMQLTFTLWLSLQLRHKCEELEREIMARTSVEVPTTPDAMSVNSNQSQQWAQSSAVWNAPGYSDGMLVRPASNLEEVLT